MKNFSWKKYLRYLIPTLVLLTAIILNLYYIPKYYEEYRKNNYQSTYTITIIGQQKDNSIFFTKGLVVKFASSLGDVLINYPNEFGLSSSILGHFVKKIDNIELDPNYQYFNIRSGDNDSPNAAHIHQDCHGTNNSCNYGIDYLKLIPNVDNVFRFVITDVMTP